MICGHEGLNIFLITGTSLEAQWFRHRASTAGGRDSSLDWGTKILHAACGQKIEKKKQLKLK